MGAEIRELREGSATLWVVPHPQPVLPGLRIRRLEMMDALFGSGVSDGSSVGLSWFLHAEEPRLLVMLLNSTRISSLLGEAQELRADITVDEVAVTARLDFGQDRQALRSLLLRLSEELTRTPARSWEECASELGLKLEWNGQRWESLTLVGELRGVPVKVTVAPYGRPRPLVRADIPAPLPRNFRILSKESATREPLGRVRLRDPILAGFIKVYAIDMEAARVIVERGGLHGPLLAVLHGRPGSSVEQGAVYVYGDDLLASGLRAVVEEAVALAEALGASARATP